MKENIELLASMVHSGNLEVGEIPRNRREMVIEKVAAIKASLTVETEEKLKEKKKPKKKPKKEKKNG